MPTVLLTRTTASAVRCAVTYRYRETLRPSGWERGRFRDGSPVVRVERKETSYREPIGTQGEKSHVTFTVTGDRRNEYLAACLPTARVMGDDGVATVAVWYY